MIRMGSLYSDEEEDVLDPVSEKIQMTWTMEKCEAERRNRTNAPENFRELISIKPYVQMSHNFRPQSGVSDATVLTLWL